RGLHADVRDQGLMLFDEIDRDIDKPERYRAMEAGGIMQAPSFDPSVETVSAFDRTVDDGALLDLVPAILPAECDMHHQIKHPKAFPAFRRPPDDDESCGWNKPLHAVIRVG